MTTQEKLSALRTAMKGRNLSAYVIPSSDPHQSEYLAGHWKSREWVSGFTGSAGTVVVTAEHAGLWTDSRYFLQAEEQLKGSDFELHKLGIPHTPEHLDWITENLPGNSEVGFDGRLFSVGSVRRTAKKFYSKNIKLNTEVDLIQEIWKTRPSLPQSPVFEHDVKFAGVSAEQKLQSLREKMGGNDYFLLSTLDDIAWLFNLRGGDVKYNPVFYAFAIIGKETAHLFIERAKVTKEVKQKLNHSGILIRPYQEVESFFKTRPDGQTIMVDPASTSNQLYNAIAKEKIVESENLVAKLKAIKNPVEINHIKEAMQKDAVALVRTFRWLEKTLKERPIPETEVAQKLDGYRSGQSGYFGESFAAIVGYNANGAIVHYHAETGACANIKPEGILLVDSGGQYLGGTTDITRTIALGAPTPEQKRDFTLVLKGHIALAQAKFPHGTTGVQLDTLARMHMWQDKVNYGHGTGHGVGFFNSVHEPPQGFSPVPHTPRANITIEPGMLTSNEPGIYKAGQYGIRTENLILCEEDGESGFGKFYKFSTLSLFPIDLALIDETLLSEAEKTWINNYHKEVFEKISPLLESEEQDWLASKCRAF